ncbi:acetyltransferase [Vibrio cholerae]|nr:acetyltransferase [Vibrio cholerae]
MCYALSAFVRCSPLNAALTLFCIYINKFNRLTYF